MAEATVTRRGLLDMQVCVPDGWTDDQVCEFANAENPCGTTKGWQVRRDGDHALDGKPERVSCASLLGFVHIMLDA